MQDDPFENVLSPLSALLSFTFNRQKDASKGQDLVLSISSHLFRFFLAIWSFNL